MTPTPLFEKSNPIQRDELPVYEAALRRTQGNILKSHGRRHTVNVFLLFTGDPVKLKEAIRKLKITSAWEQSLQKPADNAPFVGFGLSSPGYQYLGYERCRFGPEFRRGMARKYSGLNDPDISTWELQYRPERHAMILLAHADPDSLDAELECVAYAFKDLADMAIERGHAIFNGTQPMEHFGFIDGISQPFFFQFDVDDAAKKTGTSSWDPSAGTKLVLVKDPFMESDEDCGSFYVFRKLEQDVAGFLKREADLQAEMVLQAELYDNPEPHPELAGAFVVGRFRDGTPVVKSNEPAADLDNDFLYKANSPGSDSNGRRCPFSSHIRKVNPRGDTDKLGEERLVRIARRGITYGVEGTEHVGLLFQCCQRDLKSQFEFLQGHWMNQTKRPAGSAGFDPVAGESTGSNQQWPRQWGTGLKLKFDFGGFVTLKGGGYFFLPSITFLKQI